ncbi:MAG: hypothetical protein M0Q92_08240 [Methanoregula sp.]|jgi:hypothetical protein|nr:hypothetical protein [Methanoregula sp.]
MKKRYLTWAGILSAGILAILFIYILATGSFTIFPTATINPVADLHAGEMLVITGTTNLPAGADVFVHCNRSPRLPDTDPAIDRFGGRVSIVHGSGLSNTWSLAMDTAAIAPGEYIVSVNRWIPVNASNASYRAGDLLATSRFRLTGTGSGMTQPGNAEANRSGFITVNPPGTRQAGEKFFLNGTTNLPAETELLLVVEQRDNVATFTLDPKTREKTEKAGHTETFLLSVLPGTGGTNRWSTVVDTVDFIPGYYLVNISTTKGNFEAGNFTTGDIFSTSYLVVRESSANSTYPR